MRSFVSLAISTAMLSACSPDPNRPLYENPRDLAWAQCIFELDKIEALRGRNLDDLDAGHTSARNQFLMDCMSANDAAIDFKHLDEMSRYLAGREKRQQSEMTLNSADRSLPYDPAAQIQRQQADKLSQKRK